MRVDAMHVYVCTVCMYVYVRVTRGWSRPMGPGQGGGGRTNSRVFVGPTQSQQTATQEAAPEKRLNGTEYLGQIDAVWVS